MSQALDNLKAAVTKIEQRGDATITLLKGIAAELRAHKDDAAEVERIAVQLESQAAEFDAAIAENTTPSAPPSA